MQSRRQSLIEVCTGTFVGMIGSWLITYGIMKALRADPWLVSTAQVIGCTIWSLARGYVIRRLYERRARRE